jgi:hypothetical protein
MNFSDNTDANDANVATTLSRSDAAAVLAREAGVSFQLPVGGTSEIDPIAQWLSLMEVVQILCPVWPVRDKPIQGDHWQI